MKRLSTQAEVLDAGIRLLARREYSETELRRKLVARTDSQAFIDSTVHRLQELGYLSDERFTQSYLRYGISQGKGPAWLRMQLMQKGIAEPMIQAQLQALDIDWFEQARALLQRKFSYRALEPALKAKQFRYLSSRGYASDTVCRAMDALESAPAQ